MINSNCSLVRNRPVVRCAFVEKMGITNVTSLSHPVWPVSCRVFNTFDCTATVCSLALFPCPETQLTFVSILKYVRSSFVDGLFVGLVSLFVHRNI